MNTERKHILKMIHILSLSLVLLLPVGWSISIHAYDCVLDEDGDGVGDGTSGASSSSDPNRLACGNNASALNSNSTAVGANAAATGTQSVAIGRGALASSLDSISLGNTAGINTSGATATNSVGSIAIGVRSSISDDSQGAIAIGADIASDQFGAQVDGENAIAIGAEAQANKPGSIAFGAFALANGSDSTAMGEKSFATGEFSTAIGQSAQSRSNFSTTLGFAAGFNNGTAVTDSPSSISIGYYANVKPDSTGAIAIGGDNDGDEIGAEASGAQAIAIGEDAISIQPGAIALGANAVADGPDSTAVGRAAFARGNSSTALGFGANASEFFSTALGKDAVAKQFSTALGHRADASGNGSTSIGKDATSQSAGVVTLGFEAGFNNGVDVIDSPTAIAIGYRANIKAASRGAIAIGGDDNLTDGIGAEAAAIKAIAIGADAKATEPGAIAIGADVVADIPNTLVTNVPILARDPDTTVVPRTMFEISGFGNTKFTVTNADKNEQWAFANPGTGFRLSRQGSGSVEFEVKNNGNAVLAGTLTENSDINSKQDIKTLDQQSILDKVMELDIAEWRYKDDPQSRHIGPMAQDFYQAFELGDTDKGISTLDSSGVALAAIQALKKDNEQLRYELRAMKKQLAEIKDLKHMIIQFVEHD